MALFESLKQFPKIDLHIDFFGSIDKETIYELTKNRSREEVDSLVEFESLKDYDNSKQLVKSLLNSYQNITYSLERLIDKLKNDNLLYGEIFINLDMFIKKLDKKEIIKTIIDCLKREDIKLNIVLEIDSSIKKEDLYDNLNILYEYYNKGINGIYFKKNKFDNLESFKALFDKFTKDNINYIILQDTKLTKGDKEIYYNASRIIYNMLEIPDDSYLSVIRDNNIILEIPITYQSYFNLYDSLDKHIIYDLYKENINIAWTTIDMTSLNTDLLNEYCKIFNVFPFNLHDLTKICLNILNIINVNLDEKNKLIDEFREKANELL